MELSTNDNYLDGQLVAVKLLGKAMGDGEDPVHRVGFDAASFTIVLSVMRKIRAYRALYILNWICRYLTQPHFNGWIFGKAIPSFNCQHEHHLPGLAFEASIASMSFKCQHKHHQASIPFLPFTCRSMICQECSDYFPKIPHGLDPISSMLKNHVAAEGTTLVKQAEDAASNKRLQVDPPTWPIMIFRIC
ncbi:unnamed protein product [Lactuca saligna]|uniref:Uncharacterized protein n=1 Tax=Lactuca saligna TaxID=75948 RepID=A0AA36EHI3_LACSI|nr:unnamed protein product [Lactuca saligna]